MAAPSRTATPVESGFAPVSFERDQQDVEQERVDGVVEYQTAGKEVQSFALAEAKRADLRHAKIFCTYYSTVDLLIVTFTSY